MGAVGEGCGAEEVPSSTSLPGEGEEAGGARDPPEGEGGRPRQAGGANSEADGGRCHPGDGS